MVASLNDIGFQMGKTGTIKLSEIGTKGASQGGTNGYNRTFVTAANDYKRVNPYAVAGGLGAGDAPDPIGITTPYRLSDWDAYDQWDATAARPSSFNCTNITTTGANSSQATFSFNIDSAFTDFNTNGVNVDITYTVHIRQCGASIGNCVDGFGDPLDPSASPTDTINSDTSPASSGFLNDGTWFIAGLYVQWDDESVANYTRISEAGYTASLSNGSGITDSGTAEEYIRFFTPDWFCTLDSLGTSTTNNQDSDTNRDETTDSRCEACYNYNQVGNRVTRYRGTSTDTIGDAQMNLYTDNGCTTEDTSTQWYSPDGSTAYQLGTTTTFDCSASPRTSTAGCLV